MTRAGRLLLLLYPGAFRRRHGGEFLEALEAQRAEDRYAGRRGSLRFWRDVLTDAVPAAARLRLRAGARIRRAPAPAHVVAFPPRPGQMDILRTDLRFALRGLARRPGFTAAAVLTLAIGIGGASLIFGLVDGLVIRPFHYPDPDRLVAVGVSFPRVSARESYIEALSPAEYLDIRGARSLVHVLGFDLGNRNLSGGDVPERVFTALVFDDPFATLGLRPALGRGFTRDELLPGGPPVAVLSHRVWQTRFGADPALVGRAIRVGGSPVTVVGIMPAGLLLVGTDLWLPLQADPAQWPRGRRQFNVLARLAPAASRAEAAAELATIAARVETDHARQFPEYEGWRLVATPWAEALTRPLRPAAWLLAVAVLFLLVIVCANIAGLQVARVTGRQRELGVRVALGAGSMRIARELLTESVVLAGAGGLAGLGVAVAGLRVATAVLPDRIVNLGVTPSVDGRVLGAALLVTIVATLLMGVLPAVVGSRLGSGALLDAHAPHLSAGRGASRLRQGLVVMELALALVLLVGAGLMARTLWEIGRIDPGVDTSRVLTMRLTLPWEKYQGPQITRFFDAVLDRLRSTPGVAGAATASQFPPNVFADAPILLESRDAPAASTSIPNAYVTIVSPAYFEMLGVGLREGRLLTPADRIGAAAVAVVNEAFARRYFGGAPAVGRRVGVARGGGDAVWMEVVGVVRDTLALGVTAEPAPEAFVSMDQAAGLWNQLFLLVRTEGDPRSVLADVRRIVAALDPDQPVYAIQTLDEAFAASILQHRASTILMLAFAGLAVALAAMGVYAITAYAVALRTQEFGLRMALGARAGDLVRLVIRQVGLMLAVGAVLGIAGGIGLGRLASGLLVEIGPGDPVTLSLVTAVLLAAGLLAGYLPARRAARIDPVRALRVD